MISYYPGPVDNVDTPAKRRQREGVQWAGIFGQAVFPVLLMLGLVLVVLAFFVWLTS